MAMKTAIEVVRTVAGVTRLQKTRKIFSKYMRALDVSRVTQSQSSDVNKASNIKAMVG
jgi:hypothetical protein